MNNRGKAFTLAEVLITLGIIGVVAAMTLPTVITKYQKKTAAVRLKKLFLNYENALMLTESQESATREQWKFNSTQERNLFIKEKLIPNLNCRRVIEQLGNSNIARQAPICILKDGSMIVFHTIQASALTLIELYFILEAKDLYNNDLTFGKNAFYHATNLASKSHRITDSRAALLNTCRPTHENGNGPNTFDYSARNCLKLIRYDNWEIKNDYPW